MIFLNQKSTDQTESLGGDGATTVGGGTPGTCRFWPVPTEFYRCMAYTVWLWLGLSPPRLREEEGFALNASTTLVLHTKVTRNS